MALERVIARSYTHTQDTPSASWVIVHNLGVYPIVDAWTMHDGDLQKIIPAEVTHTDNNTVTLTFSVARSGFATVV